jgi:colicin import membrane protein
MSRLGINLTDVAMAAEALVEAGESPTIENIRAQLGKRGSYSTISKYLKAWREGEPVTQSTPLTPPDQVQAAVSAVWSKLHEETELKMAAVQAEAREQVAAAQLAAEVAQSALADLQAQHEALTTQHHTLAAQKELLVLDLRQAEVSQQLLRERYEALETRHHEIKAVHDQHLQRLEEKYLSEITRLTVHADQEVGLARQLTDTIKMHHEEARVEQMRERDALKVELQKKEALIKQLEVDQATLKASLEGKMTLHQQVRAELHESQKMLQNQQAQWTSLQDKRFVTEEIVSAFEALPGQVASELQGLLAEQVKTVIERASSTLRKKRKDVEHA